MDQCEHRNRPRPLLWLSSYTPVPSTGVKLRKWQKAESKIGLVSLTSSWVTNGHRCQSPFHNATFVLEGYGPLSLYSSWVLYCYFVSRTTPALFQFDYYLTSSSRFNISSRSKQDNKPRSNKSVRVNIDHLPTRLVLFAYHTRDLQ